MPTWEEEGGVTVFPCASLTCCPVGLGREWKSVLKGTVSIGEDQTSSDAGGLADPTNPVGSLICLGERRRVPQGSEKRDSNGSHLTEQQGLS